MAKKSVTKSKGPKGKKARAKAKLEKRWGEQVDEKEVERSKFRRGKSRLTTKNSGGSSRRRPHEDTEDLPINTRSEDVESDDENENLIDGGFSSLMQSINRKSRKPKNLVDKDDEGDDEGDDDAAIVEEETDEDNEVNQNEDGESSEEDEIINDVYEDLDEPEKSTDDPFSAHFSRETLPENESSISDILEASQSTLKVKAPFLEDSLDIQLSKRLVDDLGVKHEQDAEKSHNAWQNISTGFFNYNRKVLKENWRKNNRGDMKSNLDSSLSISKNGAHLTSLQSLVYPAMASYADILLTAETYDNRNSLNNLVSLHILNHVLTARGRVQRNNKQVRDTEENEDAEHDSSVRDQGYTRPTVLVLLPTRGRCFSFIKTMLKLLGDAAALENMDRFDSEFGPLEPLEEDEVDDAVNRHRKKVNAAKGVEWNELFGDDANNDDDFKIGLSFSPKAVKETKKGNKSGVGVRLYTDFYKSDIIITSPLALKMTTGNDEEDEGDVDFLTSIEICFVDSSDVLMMQNWDHVTAAFENMNQQPKKTNNTDFSRVREYLLAGQAKFWRQLIVSSRFQDPCVLSTFKRNACSTSGVLKIRRRVSVNEASLANVMVATKQVFHRIPCKSFASQGDDRLEYFEQHVLPQIERSKQKHTMIYVPSYFEFISLRNLLLKREMDFVSVTEYARVSEVSRGRARFLQGRKSIMLYTGRAHFFSRHTIKGAKHLIFFGLPEHSEFYSDIANMLNLGFADGNDGGSSCLALFTKYEAHALERICGRQNAERMLQGEKSTFLFVS